MKKKTNWFVFFYLFIIIGFLIFIGFKTFYGEVSEEETKLCFEDVCDNIFLRAKEYPYTITKFDNLTEINDYCDSINPGWTCEKEGVLFWIGCEEELSNETELCLVESVYG